MRQSPKLMLAFVPLWLASAPAAHAQAAADPTVYVVRYIEVAPGSETQGAALVKKLAERHESKPSERRWKLAVCGPHRSPQVELGPDFETTWDPQGADFALMLGEFYCATFDAPILVEVVRAGVVYARVYDIRGRSFPSLLTMPAP